MNAKVLKFMLCVLLVLSVALLSGCEKIMDMGMTDGVVTPPDTEPVLTLKIGVIQPPEYYASFARAAELARSEINQAGRVLGMQIEFIYKNNQSAPGVFPDPETSVQVATELVEEENVVALLGPIFSTNAVQVAPIIQRPILPAASGANVTEAGEFIFLVSGSNALHGRLMAQFVTDELRAKTAITIHQDGDVYSIGLVEAFTLNFQQLGGEVVASDVYQLNDKTFSAQLEQVQTVNPDVLFLASFAPEVPLLMKEAREMGIESVFVGGDGMDDPENFLGTLADNTPLEGTYYTTNLYKTTDDPDAPQFIDDYTATFGSPPDGVAASGYDAVRLLAIAIETVQSTDPVAIRDAISSITNYQGATTISHFDEKRRAVKSAGILEIRDGQPQPYSVIAPYVIDEAE